MMTELSRREKEANIKPDPDIDVYMKVRKFFKDLCFDSIMLNFCERSTLYVKNY